MRKALAVTSALQGQPSNATLSIAHNDSWLFEDNVDATHPANLRYVIASTTQRIVSARLSIHLAPYRTYNSLTLTSTGTENRGHNYGHGHTISSNGNPQTATLGLDAGSAWTIGGGGVGTTPPTNSDSTGESQTHSHTVSGSATLGVTEGATATNVTIAFDGVDATAALGGPFAVDQIELDVTPYLITTKDAWHVIAMEPSGLGRIEAHLRLGMYVSAGQVN